MTDLSRPYPREWTVERALDAYLGENGFEKDEYDAAWVSVSFWWLTFPFPNPPQRRKAVRLHDLHHVATGYGTDPAGEAEISAWELRRGLRGLRLFVKGIVTSGALFGLLHSPRRTVAAWRLAAARAGTLFDRSLEHDYPRMLAWSVGELREHLRLPQDGLRRARAALGRAEARLKSAGETERWRSVESFMDPERQRVLSEFVATEMAKTPKTLRIFSVLGLLLCGGGLALLAAVFFDGGATFDDIGPPLVLFGIFTAVSLLGAVWTTARLRSLPNHPLVVALRAQPEDIARLIPTVIVGRGGRTPALTFELRSGKSQLVIMGERTRAELMAWLSREGAHVG